jgi:hypothetical protein
MEGEEGEVLQKMELQSSVAVAPPCVVSQLLKIWLILGCPQFPFAPEAGVVITGATLLKMVNIFTTLLELLHLSVAVNVTGTAPQKDVMIAGDGALSVRDNTPHPLSVAVKAARWALSHVVYWAMAVEQGAMPF